MEEANFEVNVGVGPGQIVQYLDLQSLPDNSRYVPDLTKGELQPLEVMDEEIPDEVLSQIDFNDRTICEKT